MSKHTHRWEPSDLIIDTYPEIHTWRCDCKRSSHDGGETIATCCGLGAKEKRENTDQPNPRKS